MNVDDQRAQRLGAKVEARGAEHSRRVGVRRRPAVPELLGRVREEVGLRALKQHLLGPK